MTKLTSVPAQGTVWLAMSHLSVKACGIALVLTGTLAVSVVPAQAEMASSDEPLWVARYDGPNHWYDIAYASALSPDGTALAVTGQSDPTKSSPSADYATVLYATATGQQRWVASYDGPANGWDAPADIAWSPDGTTLYVTGRCRGKGSKRDFATIAYEAATGKQLWVAQYDDRKRLGDAAVSLAVSPDGSTVFVSGRSHVSDWWQPAGNRVVFATVAYDAETGGQLWVRRLDPTGVVNYLDTSLLTPDGRTLLVVGWGWGGGGGLVSETAAYDTQSGRVKWVRLIRGTTVSAAVSPDGDTVFVAGTQRHPPHKGPFVVALDVGTGKPHWSAVAEMPGGAVGAVAWDVALSPDGTSLYATGSGVWSREGCYGEDITTVAYDTATGDEQWRARYDGPGQGVDWAQAVATSPDGSTVYVSGTSSGFGGDRACVVGTPNTGFDFATVAYDAASGAQLWVRRYDSPGRAGIDSAHAMVVDGQGSIYVSGESTSDFLTLRYNP